MRFGAALSIAISIVMIIVTIIGMYTSVTKSDNSLGEWVSWRRSFQATRTKYVHPDITYAFRLGIGACIFFVVQSILRANYSRPPTITSELIAEGLLHLPILAGLLASKENGKVADGVRASIYMGLMYCLLFSVLFIVDYNFPLFTPRLVHPGTDLGSFVEELLFGLPIVVLLPSALIGMLTGRIGRHLWRKRRETSHLSEQSTTALSN